MKSNVKGWTPKLGESGWEVEWCEHIPLIQETGDADLDACKFEGVSFRSYDDALSFARAVYPKDAFGSVGISPFTIFPLSDTCPYGKSREYTGETVYYEGDNESAS